MVRDTIATMSTAAGQDAITTTERAAESLGEFLQRHPWPDAWRAFGPTVDHFWTYDVAMPKHAVWPVLTDTSAMNQRLGQPEMKFREENGRLVGSTVRAGMELVWDEVPWQWEHEHSLSNERIYRSGMLRYNRGIFEVHDAGPDRSRVTIYFGGVPRTWLGRLALRYGMLSLRSRFAAVFDELSRAYREQRTPPPPGALPVLGEEPLARLREIESGLVEDGVEPSLATRLTTFVRESDDDAAARIRPRALAVTWGLDAREVIVAFLHATRRGLFVLSWDAVCPHCRGSRAQLLHLGEVPKAAHCDVCDIEFATTDPGVLEITFHVHPSIRPLERRQFCAAEPARKAHIYVQRTIAPKAEITVPTLLDAGRYRLRTRGSKNYVPLDLAADANEQAVSWRIADRSDGTLAKPHPVVRVENPSETEATFVIESRDEDRAALRPADLFAIQDFRDLFSAESIAADVQIDIGRQTILFTDVVGSTRFYEVVGDAAAFAAVRHHFREAYAIVKKHGGVVVKTIGDAVMGAFTDPASAVRASIEMQRYFNGRNPETELRIRITIHSGRCIAVNLNSAIDYFGSTVNLAAKIQAIAGAGEIAFTQPVYDDTAARAAIERESLAVATVPFEMKWTDEKAIPVYRIHVE